VQAIYKKEVEAWRRKNSCLPWTRAALNACAVAAVTKFEEKMAVYVECRCPRLVQLRLLYPLTLSPPPLTPVSWQRRRGSRAMSSRARSSVREASRSTRTARAGKRPLLLSESRRHRRTRW
jgi:hypothetical protein